MFQWLLQGRGGKGVPHGRFEPCDTCDRAGSRRSIDAGPEPEAGCSAKTRRRGRLFRAGFRSARRVFEKPARRCRGRGVQIPDRAARGRWSDPARFRQWAHGAQRAAGCVRRTQNRICPRRIDVAQGGAGGMRDSGGRRLLDGRRSCAAPVVRERTAGLEDQRADSLD